MNRTLKIGHREDRPKGPEDELILKKKVDSLRVSRKLLGLTTEGKEKVRQIEEKNRNFGDLDRCRKAEEKV